MFLIIINYIPLVTLKTESRSVTGGLETSDGAKIQITPEARRCCSPSAVVLGKVFEFSSHISEAEM